MGILHREDAAGQQICRHLSFSEGGYGSQSPIREAYHSGNFQSAVIRRDAASVGGAREGIRSSELTPPLPSA